MVKTDTAYRGPHAVHLKRHRKLGKHLTVLKCALPLINYLLSLPSVKRVHFGQLVGLAVERDDGKVHVFFDRKRYRTRVRFLVRNGRKAQWFKIETDRPIYIEERVTDKVWAFGFEMGLGVGL